MRQDRSAASPQPSRPAGLRLLPPYGVHMRNTSGGERGRWAALVSTYREAAQMTKVALAQRLGVDRGTITRWETGAYRPDDPDVVARFADLFRIDLDTALAAAGLRPVGAAAPEVPAPLDPNLVEAQAMLDDPRVPPEVKAQVHVMLQAMIDLARQQPKPPRRRRAG